MSTPINAASLYAAAVFGSLIPTQGPRAVPVPMDFSAADFYTLNYGQRENLGLLDMVQTIFIDNSGSTVDLSVFVDFTRQTLIMPAGKQGYLAVCCPNPSILTFTSPGGWNSAMVILMNFPTPSCVWPLDVTSSTFGIGPGASAFQSQALSLSGAMDFPFDTNMWDTGGIHSTSVNPERFTAPSDGYYEIMAQLSLSGLGTNSFINMGINVNGAPPTNRIGSLISKPISTATTAEGQVSGIIKLTAGDYLTMNVSVTATSVADNCMMQVTKVSTTL